jgi:hypothetical protein
MRNGFSAPASSHGLDAVIAPLRPYDWFSGRMGTDPAAWATRLPEIPAEELIADQGRDALLAALDAALAPGDEEP